MGDRRGETNRGFALLEAGVLTRRRALPGRRVTVLPVYDVRVVDGFVEVRSS